MTTDNKLAPREAFEKWAQKNGYALERGNLTGAYLDNRTLYTWYGWQSALAGCGAREGEQIDPVARGKEIAARERFQAIRPHEQAAQPQPSVDSRGMAFVDGIGWVVRCTDAIKFVVGLATERQAMLERIGAFAGPPQVKA